MNIKEFNPSNIKIVEKSKQKYSYLLYWICDNENRPKNFIV